MELSGGSVLKTDSAWPFLRHRGTQLPPPAASSPNCQLLGALSLCQVFPQSSGSLTHRWLAPPPASGVQGGVQKFACLLRLQVQWLRVWGHTLRTAALGNPAVASGLFLTPKRCVPTPTLNIAFCSGTGSHYPMSKVTTPLSVEQDRPPDVACLDAQAKSGAVCLFTASFRRQHSGKESHQA